MILHKQEVNSLKQRKWTTEHGRMRVHLHTFYILFNENLICDKVIFNFKSF